MTKREFLTEIMNSNVSEELKQYAIEHLEKQTPKQLENAALQDEIYSSYLGEEPVTAGEVAEAIESLCIAARTCGAVRQGYTKALI